MIIAGYKANIGLTNPVKYYSYF